MTHLARRQALRRIGLGALGASGVPAALAQQVPSAAASAADGSARLLFGIPPGAAGTTLAQALIGQMVSRYTPPIKIEHVLGREARRSAEVVKSALPDGNTLLHAQSALITLFPSVYRELGYAPQADFTPLASLSEYAFMLLVGPRVPASVRTLDDFLRWVGDNPAARQVGVVLKGSQGWLMAQHLVRDRDAPLQPVAYAGTTPVVNELLGGGLAAGIVVTGNAREALADGRLRALAVSSPQRWLGLPDTPCFDEIGLSGMAMTGWYGWFGPAGMAEPVVQRLRAAIGEAMATPELTQALERLSMRPLRETPEQLRERIATETTQYAQAVRQARLSRI
ncbi:tripartite tricarboxylate transporter substrate-binding protein [Aquabacterium sp. OR-4]|uniref:tripartite tricarboxylate transporter substrate-binding protein n=1 Tax=Aquabacterium sp. OR-4 TaxID=2978127 RepID=UPI0021B41012|nr:tripartite tricarboxylate transporter substrate-binding protein [Aquabacterium sp. OR-4]MDT7834254.1 tripartite tricarboxylate transporter substrate-binding protein [Aquabacterium sp. OR-4]